MVSLNSFYLLLFFSLYLSHQVGFCVVYLVFISSSSTIYPLTLIKSDGLNLSYLISWLFPVVLLLSGSSSLALIVHFESNLTLQDSSGVCLLGIVGVIQGHLSELLAHKGMASRFNYDNFQ